MAIAITQIHFETGGGGTNRFHGPYSQYAKNGTIRHHTISWRTASLSLLLAACVALLSALGRAWGWGVLKGSRMFSWEATQPIALQDIYLLVSNKMDTNLIVISSNKIDTNFILIT